MAGVPVDRGVRELGVAAREALDDPAVMQEGGAVAFRGAHAADSAALAPLVKEALRPGDVVLVKGALGSRMALVVRALTELPT